MHVRTVETTFICICYTCKFIHFALLIQGEFGTIKGEFAFLYRLNSLCWITANYDYQRTKNRSWRGQTF